MAFAKRTIDSVPLHGKTVLLRADYNVPLNDDGTIADDFRIRSSLPTVKKLLDMGCKVVCVSHLGRPDGQPNPKYSLEPAAQRLAELLGEPVRFVDETISHKAEMAVKRAPSRGVIMLENLRFDSREEANDFEFAERLARVSQANYFVQDGFGVVHRAHASTSAITQYLPSVAGLLLEREVNTITNAMVSPKRPLLAVLGGAKVSDKIAVIEALVDVADRIFIGGAMANTFFAKCGVNMGKSKFETDQYDVIDRIYDRVRAKVGEDAINDFLVLPDDLEVSETLTPAADEPRRIVLRDGVGENDIALDIGDATIERLAGFVRESGTVIWNGTLGMAETIQFANGSARLSLELAIHPEITSIVGGGDTADFVINWDARHGDSFTHVSTGGGASLELMAGQKLPGVEALLDA